MNIATTKNTQPRMPAQCVREILTLEEAIRRTTSLLANRPGLTGNLCGNQADIALLHNEYAAPPDGVVFNAS